jgi:hypothetical protein
MSEIAIENSVAVTCCDCVTIITIHFPKPSKLSRFLYKYHSLFVLGFAGDHPMFHPVAEDSEVTGKGWKSELRYS